MMKRMILQMVLVLVAAIPTEAQESVDHNFEVGKNLEIFNAVIRNLDMMYVDTLDAKKVVSNGINHMLQSLDPYTVYYPDANELQSFLSGKYAGIGALIRYNLVLDNAVIDEPYENTPAQEAGLKKGDIILSIDDSTMVGKSTSYVSSHLRGDAGTTFLLKFRRPSTGKVMQKKITRRQIQQMATIPYYGLRRDSIGYISLSQFTEGCSKEVRRAFIDMKNRGMKALVFDLRGNGGGSEAEAASIVNMFVPKGITVVSNKGKLSRSNHDYKTTVEPIDTVMPVVVLVDGNTASASEITSGALQDLDRAVILGTRTYGKGLVQLPLELPYNAQMKVTTSKYFIPSGRCIQAINYSRNGTGGYRERVPDSLTHVFHTAAGREVRDGGGITPDVEVKNDTIPNIAFYLSGSGQDSTEVMFDWVTDYINRHPTIAAPREFHLTDEEFADFKQCVVKSGFTYDPVSQKQLKQLEKTAKAEGYYEQAREAFELLESKLKHDVATDIDKHEDILRQIIELDIIAAYYYQAGSIEAGLQHDKQLKEAIRLLQQPETYKKLLIPKKSA
jgi:carboxyl-terminal processing protease